MVLLSPLCGRQEQDDVPVRNAGVPATSEVTNLFEALDIEGREEISEVEASSKWQADIEKPDGFEQLAADPFEDNDSGCKSDYRRIYACRCLLRKYSGIEQYVKAKWTEYCSETIDLSTVAGLTDHALDLAENIEDDLLKELGISEEHTEQDPHIGRLF